MVHDDVPNLRTKLAIMAKVLDPPIQWPCVIRFRGTAAVRKMECANKKVRKRATVFGATALANLVIVLPSPGTEVWPDFPLHTFKSG